MKRKIVTVVILLVLGAFIFEILTNSSSILDSVNFSIGIWKNNIFPLLFPFFVVTEIAIHYGVVEFLAELFKPIMQKVFKINSNSAFVFGMSMISGFPSSAKYARELYLNGLLNEYEASKVLTFSYFSNPLFILGTVSVLFLNNKEVGLLILLCHYLTNIIIGIVFRNYYPSETKREKTSFKQALINMHNKRINNDLTFGKIITNSLVNSINTLLLILGVISMFLVITQVIDNNLNISNYLQTILNGFIEMTQGLKYISLLYIPLKLKSTLSTMIISFGGLSVHVQMISILSDTKIKYLPFLIARILHAVISSLLVFIMFDFWILYI